ncbi:MAG: glycine cleavage T C-terminal barrel domain-containing protein [Gemmatimonadota bacterium]
MSTSQEYAAAREGAVVIERDDRTFIRVHGRDPVRMIQGLVSNDVSGAPFDRAVYAAVLTPKGRMVADTRILRHGSDLLLETAVAAADGLAAHLRKFVPPLFARFEDVTRAWSLTGVYGPAAPRIIRDVFGIAADVSEDVVHNASLDGAPVWIITTSLTGDAGFDILVEIGSGGAEGVVRRAVIDAGAVPIGADTLEVLRIEAGRPLWGAELDETTIPLEAGLRARAISESKGCYTGQEVIVRILHRGHVNWLLRGVLLGDAAVPDRGALLFRDGRSVGRITSAAQSPRHAQTIALAYVRREVEPPAALRLGDVDGPVADVVQLPFP